MSAMLREIFQLRFQLYSRINPRNIITAIVLCIPIALYFMPKKFVELEEKAVEVVKGDPVNVTQVTNGEFDCDIMVYNRAPKCGSIYMTRLIWALSSGMQNEFDVQSPYEPGEHPVLSLDERSDIVKEVHGYKGGKPLAYIRHQTFIDFAECNAKRPLYINMVREPLSRFESLYYFIRNGNEEGDGADVDMDDAALKRTIDECVEQEQEECTKPDWAYVQYFCGSEELCGNPCQLAVEKAKENIEKYFAFVGIIEELDNSLEVLEQIMPKFFRNARKVAHDGSSIQNDTFTLKKIHPSEASAKYLRTQTSIKFEVDLYNWITSRFWKIRSQLNL